MKKILSILGVFSSIVMAIAPIGDVSKNKIGEIAHISASTPLDFQTSIQETSNILDDNVFAGHYSHRSHSSHYSHSSHQSHQSHSSHYSSYY